MAIRSGTRKSVMALAQTEEVARRLTAVALDVFRESRPNQNCFIGDAGLSKGQATHNVEFLGEASVRD